MADNVKVLIVFYSRNGSTAALAEGIAEGARSEGVQVELRRVDEFLSDDIINGVPGWQESREKLKAKYAAPTIEDAETADAIIFGSPTRFGNVSAELKSYVDSLGGLWMRGVLNGKVGSAFTSTSTPARRQRKHQHHHVQLHGASRPDYRAARLQRPGSVCGGYALRSQHGIRPDQRPSHRRRPRRRPPSG